MYVGGDYRDFPRTSVLKNIILGRMDDNESLNDRETGVFLEFVKLDSEKNRDLVLQELEKTFHAVAPSRAQKLYTLRLTSVIDIYFTNDLQADP